MTRAVCGGVGYGGFHGGAVDGVAFCGFFRVLDVLRSRSCLLLWSSRYYAFWVLYRGRFWSQGCLRMDVTKT